MKDVYDTEKLIDVSKLTFKNELLIKEMLENFITKVKNPYHFKSGKVEIEILYSTTEKTVYDLLKDYFLNEK